MVIKLNEITEEAKIFSFPQGDRELLSVLRDLIGPHVASAEASIRRTNAQTFELKGWIRTAVPEQCSRCAEDISLKVDEVFRELLIPASTLPRDGKQARVNHISDLHAEEGPSVTEYESENFDLGAFFREVILIACPDYPAPDVDAAGNCQQCKIQVAGKSFSYDEDFASVESPFSVLKNIKLN